MITTSRNNFLGAHVTKDVKSAIKDEAVIQGKSISLLVHEILKAEMQKRGHALEEAA